MVHFQQGSTTVLVEIDRLGRPELTTNGNVFDSSHTDERTCLPTIQHCPLTAIEPSICTPPNQTTDNNRPECFWISAYLCERCLFRNTTIVSTDFWKRDGLPGSLFVLVTSLSLGPNLSGQTIRTLLEHYDNVFTSYLNLAEPVFNNEGKQTGNVGYFKIPSHSSNKDI